MGSPIAGANREETEGLIGFFLNTVVMRAELSGEVSVSEALRRVREAALGAYTHQDLPFEKLIEELQPQRSLSHEPYFQVLFIFQNAPATLTGISNLSAGHEPMQIETARFDLTLSLFAVGENVIGSFEYATDLYDEARIARLVGHLNRMFEGHGG